MKTIQLIHTIVENHNKICFGRNAIEIRKSQDGTPRKGFCEIGLYRNGNIVYKSRYDYDTPNVTNDNMEVAANALLLNILNNDSLSKPND